MAKKSVSARLPNAPLAEVVFELRWQLLTGPGGTQVLQSDPGMVPLLDNFSKKAKQLGFVFSRDMSHPLQTGPYGVVRRFYESAERPFPLLQVGVGILATNASSEYQWSEFKSRALTGVRALLQSYPKMDFFQIVPSQIELRYVDVFDKAVLGRVALFPFLNSDSAVKIDLPSILVDKKKISGDAVGRFHFQSDLRERASSTISLDLASGKHLESSDDIIRMETTVRSIGNGAPRLKSTATFIKDVGLWLEFAHGLTSPLFKEIIGPAIMAKLKAS